MKTVLTVLVLSGLVSGTALGGDSTNKPETKQKTAQAENQSKTKSTPAREKRPSYLTGSYIKQNVRRKGQITDGVSQVVVLDQNTIEHSGATDVRQLLVREGIH